MSVHKLVSPLLDGFVMGDPISSHGGISCCPAMRENSDERYIVKIISVPASQKQLDALLLTGAYPDAAAATAYFKGQADDIVKEAQLLQQLSKLEGFLPYTGWQITPMDNNQLGYYVHLISPYKRTLEKQLRRSVMTHLGAVNLGLDLCSALSVCRRAGYIHADLKPSNIFLTAKREYRIGDLGFVNLNSLKFTSLPEKFRSRYAAPELHDDLVTLNPTADIYAVGMILYQIYNDGQIPFETKAPEEALPPPANADYEMAEIILKACDPNPRKRWQTPIEMGQALVSYMQRNRVNDVPIVPPNAADSLTVTEPPVTADSDEELTAQDSGELSFLQEMVSDETAPDGDQEDILADTDISDEVTSMLSEADELIDHELPGGVVEPEYREPVLPQPEEPEESEVPEPDGEISEPAEEAAAESQQPEVEQEEDDFDFESLINPNTPKKPVHVEAEFDEGLDDDFFRRPEERKKKKGWIGVVIALLIVALLGAGAVYFYTSYYLLPIENMEIRGFEDTITVLVTTDVDESILTVVCKDTYGNTLYSPIENGKAVFNELNPDMLYKISLEVEGFHRLSGSVSGSYTTLQQTKILSFTAMTGTEDGSANLSFTVDGPEKQDWILEYQAADEELRTVSFTGHSVSINGLTVGKTYTFRLLSPISDLWIVGSDTLEFTASEIIVADNLNVVSCVDGVLTVQWNTPAGATVSGWSIRCYNDSGYDETVTTAENSAQFSGISSDKAYTVEVLADGMTQNTRAYVTANPTTVTDIQVAPTEEDPYKLSIVWQFQGNAPEGGWLLMYSTDGSEGYEVIQCQETSAVIPHKVPGATYKLSIQAADGSTVFGGKKDFPVPEAGGFNSYNVDSSKIQASLCPTPKKANWTYKDVSDKSYTSTYAAGSQVSMVVYTPDRPNASIDQITILFVIRDAEGKVIPQLVKTTTGVWNNLWNNRGRYCGLDIPLIPSIPGSYTVSVYFNGAHMITKNLIVTE